MLLGIGAGFAYMNRGMVRSIAIRLLARSLPNAATKRGVHIDLGPARGGWIRLVLQADLSATLREVTGVPWAAAAYSRFGGFNRSRIYSDFLNPTSPYYQAWFGAYIVFDTSQGEQYGFAADGSPQTQAALDMLEADQRLVYSGAGVDKRFDDERCVRLLGEFQVEQVQEGEHIWWRMTGEAETWSVYYPDGHPRGNWKHFWTYGQVPLLAPHDVEPFHPLRYRGEFWQRHDQRLGATCAKFFVYPEYETRSGRRVTWAEQLVPECQTMLRTVRFYR